MSESGTDLTKAINSIADSLERLATAIEKRNELDEQSTKCHRCHGDGKDYGGSRCVACAGSGVKQMQADCRASDIDCK